MRQEGKRITVQLSRRLTGTTRFTEGFDTKDLQEAKALLEELSHCRIESLNH
jgi:hypothetical protein